MLNKNIFCNYPDAMTLAQLAEGYEEGAAAIDRFIKGE